MLHRNGARTRIAIVVTLAIIVALLPLGSPIQAAPIDPKLDEVPLENASEPVDDAVPLPSDLDHAPAPLQDDEVFESEVEAPRDFDMVGVVADPGDEPPERARLRVSDDGETWGEWYDLDFHGEHGPDVGTHEAGIARPGTEPVYTGEARYVQIHTDDDQDDLNAVTIDSDGSTASIGEKAKALIEGTLEGEPAGSLPGIITRSQWGADESLRRCEPNYAKVQLAFVHHTAGSNSYSSGGAAGVVRSIYQYHTQSRGWCDIGYNFLVDRFGRTYEGRFGGIKRAVVGAHVSGFNSLSTGIAVMGDFRSSGVPGAVFPALEHAIAWKLRQHNVNPLGSVTVTSGGGTKFPPGQQVTLRRVSGHRDAGSTTCPGGNLYAQLGRVAQNAAAIWHTLPPPPPPLNTAVLNTSGDFNGDNRDDVVTFTRGGAADVYVATSDGKRFNGWGKKWHNWFALGAEIPLVGDFNGDGKDDIVTFTGGSSADAYVALSNGKRFSGTGSRWHGNIADGKAVPAVGDFNGDGRDDIAAFDRGGSGDVFVALSQGSKFGPRKKWHDWFSLGDEIPSVGDFDGDGKDDIVTFTRGNTADVYVALSTGAAFDGTGNKWHGWFGAGSETTTVGDFNGDGRDDVITFLKGLAGDVYVATSTGSRFTGSKIWHGWFSIGDEVPGIGDFDRDGRDDVTTFLRGSAGDVYVARSNGSRLTNSRIWHDWFSVGSELPQSGIQID